MKTNDITKAPKSRIVPVCACLAVQVCVGIIYLWSVFNSPVTASFALSADSGSMVSSYMLFAFVIGCLAGGVLNDRRGPRFTITLGVIMFGVGVGSTGLLSRSSAGLIYFTYAMLGGLGSGFAYTSCLSCVQKWLPEKRGFASGLAAAAFGFSTVVFAPLSRWIMNIFTDTETELVDFKPVFLILGGVFLFVGLMASLFISSPPEDESAVSGASAQSVYPDSLSAVEIVKTPPFWCIFFTIFFGAATWTLVLPLISDLGVQRGLSLSAATLTVSLTGIVNTLGRLALASLSDKIGRHGAVVTLSVLTVIGALMLTAAEGVAYSIAIMLIAFAYGGPGPLAGALAVDFFGARNSARNFGLITLSLGFSSVLCGTISSRLLHGSPSATFIMAAVMACIPAILMLPLRRFAKKLKK